MFNPRIISSIDDLPKEYKEKYNRLLQSMIESRLYFNEEEAKEAAFAQIKVKYWSETNKYDM